MSRGKSFERMLPPPRRPSVRPSLLTAFLHESEKQRESETAAARGEKTHCLCFRARTISSHSEPSDADVNIVFPDHTERYSGRRARWLAGSSAEQGCKVMHSVSTFVCLSSIHSFRSAAVLGHLTRLLEVGWKADESVRQQL